MTSKPHQDQGSKTQAGISFRLRITLLTAALVALVTAITLGTTLHLTERQLKQELGNQLLGIATTVALSIDGDVHRTLVRVEQMESPAYKKIKGLLVKARTANRDRHVRHLYTMARTDETGIVRFVVDSDESESGAKVGDQFDARKLPVLLSSFNGEAAEPDFVRDETGEVTLSGYAPIYDREGAVVGIVGADAVVEGLDAMRTDIVIRLAIVLLIGLLLAFAAGMYSGRVLARPLDRIVQDAARASTGDYETKFQVDSTPEFARLGDALNRMLEGLRDRERVVSTFERYVSPDIARKIQSSERSVLEGERRNVTVLFSDVSDFTSLAERMRPEDVLATLNEYFTRMLDVLFAHEGTLDKFIGDNMMCLFGAPLDLPDHPVRAVRAALRMQQEVSRINAERMLAKRPALRVSMGIHTGGVVAGNIGSEKRLEYSVIGDAVNVASRVQGQAGPGEILVTRTTWEFIKGDFECLALEERQVKGRDEPVQLFQVIGERKQTEGQDDRRMHLRARVLPQVRCLALDDEREIGRVVELGQGGCAVLAGDPLAEGQVVLAIDLSEGTLMVKAIRTQMIELDAVCPDFQFVHRFRFVDLSLDETERLKSELGRMSRVHFQT